MITISNASDALKTIYLGVIAEQLNTKINPFLAAVERTSNNVFGKEVKKLVTYGVNGGITSGTETGALPKAQGNSYVTLTTDLKKLFRQNRNFRQSIESQHGRLGRVRKPS